MYRMKFTNMDGGVHESPIILSNSKTRHREEDPRIPKNINKIGKSMIRSKIIKSFEIIIKEEL